MRIKKTHNNLYKLYASVRPQKSLDAYQLLCQKKVKAWETLKREGVSDKTAQAFSHFSRASYYRAKKTLLLLEKNIVPPSKRPHRTRKPRWGEKEKQLVLQLRRANPTYGKAKIARIMKRDHGCLLSESSVGRILTYLQEKGLVQKSASALRTKKKRDFAKGHAQAWTFKKYEDMELGERVQIDHMSVTKNGTKLKHFQAWERHSKFLAAEVYSHAKSSSAKRFLLDFVAKAPFPIRSIQVDGGSEFMAEFEEACQERGIPLIVLPPCRPTYNGGIERSNRILREEFYGKPGFLADSVGAVRAELKQALHKYNHYRPHSRLQGLTPMEYLTSTRLETSLQSQTM